MKGNFHVRFGERGGETRWLKSQMVRSAPTLRSGNFLYVALRLLLDLQNEVLNFSDEMGAGRPYITVTPAQLYGIETNEYAHELAQMTIQVGYIQWLRDNGYGFPSEPILKQTQNIMHMDAVLAYDENGNPMEPEWPVVDVVIGNPPFLGSQKMRTELGDKYVADLRKLYEDRIPGASDLVCYWFEKARAMIEEGKVKRAGLLATNSIRGGANRKVLERIKETGNIFWAQSDRDWILDGAAVNVSMVGFDDGSETLRSLDDKPIEIINSDLSSTGSDSTQAIKLSENSNLCFQGPVKVGAFDITNELAKQMLSFQNPNGKSNRDVIKPWMNGSDITSRNRNMWIIDFGEMEIQEAAQYESPFEYVKKNIKPLRDTNADSQRRTYWWRLGRSGNDLKEAIKNLHRFIITPRVSKFRLFGWTSKELLPDSAVVAIALDDDYSFGVLHSKLHETWALKLGTSLEDRPRYTPTTTFETFPFPWAPGAEPNDDPRVQAIAQAAKELVEQRDRWLNPQTSEVAPEDSQVVKTPKKTSEVSVKRTLTNLYNARPTWLDLAHKRLDEAVFAAYGWKSDLSDEEILEKLLALNLERGK